MDALCISLILFYLEKDLIRRACLEIILLEIPPLSYDWTLANSLLLLYQSPPVNKVQGLGLPGIYNKR